jgi:hypothetical protein
MNEHTLTRRALLRGAAAVTAAAILPLPALAAEPDVTGYAVGTIASIEESPTVDLAALSPEEWDTVGLFCIFFGAGLPDEAVASTLSRYRTPEDVDLEDALNLRDECDRRAVVGRKWDELPAERQIAGLLLGLGIVQGLEPRQFAHIHQGLQPRRVRMGLEPSPSA